MGHHSVRAFSLLVGLLAVSFDNVVVLPVSAVPPLAQADAADYPIRFVPAASVKVQDSFWTPRFLSAASVVRRSPPSVRSTTGTRSQRLITTSTWPSAMRRLRHRSNAPCGIVLK